MDESTTSNSICPYRTSRCRSSSVFVNVTHVTQPIVQLKVADAARWSAARGHPSAIREAAKQVRAGVPDNFELPLMRALTTPWFWEREME